MTREDPIAVGVAPCCPFCDPRSERESATIVWCGADAGFDLPYFVACPGCNARGPDCLSQESAAAAWARIRAGFLITPDIAKSGKTD